MQIAITSLFIASISDTCAALYGQKYGKIKSFIIKRLKAVIMHFLFRVFINVYAINFKIVNIDLIYLFIACLIYDDCRISDSNETR